MCDRADHYRTGGAVYTGGTDRDACAHTDRRSGSSSLYVGLLPYNGKEDHDAGKDRDPAGIRAGYIIGAGAVYYKDFEKMLIDKKDNIVKHDEIYAGILKELHKKFDK